jgi:polyhydroxyalkanoate synthase
MENRLQSAIPGEVAKVYREVAKRAAKVLSDFAKKRPQLSAVSDELGIAKAYMDLYFSEPGELGVFIDEKQVANLEKKMNERGYLEGSEMAATFNLLRSNDLMWSFVINNYLLGKAPFPFDMLYWNSDSTRMPAKMHSFYLRNMYLKNQLGVPGGIELGGMPIDLSKVKVPACFISTVEDHIAPWKTTYKGAKYLGGTVRFVLGGSGHVAGIVNPPAAKRYCYWTNETMPATPTEWFEGAEQHVGSWWDDWQAWMDSKTPERRCWHGYQGGAVSR